MKIKDGYVLRKVADSFVAISVGAENEGRVVKTNATGAFLWELLKSETTQDALTKALAEKYQIDEKTAQDAVESFLESLRKEDLLA